MSKIRNLFLWGAFWLVLVSALGIWCRQDWTTQTTRGDTVVFACGLWGVLGTVAWGVFLALFNYLSATVRKWDSAVCSLIVCVGFGFFAYGSHNAVIEVNREGFVAKTNVALAAITDQRFHDRRVVFDNVDRVHVLADPQGGITHLRFETETAGRIDLEIDGYVERRAASHILTLAEGRRIPIIRPPVVLAE